MLSPVLEKLLILQDRDAKRLGLEAQLQALPGEIALVEHKIASEKAAIDAARNEMRQLETDKKLLETEIGLAEEKVGKYQTQQMAVKKNDEYQALGHEIETMASKIGALEEKELEIMYAIDGAKQRFQAAEAEMKQNISGHESRIATLRERSTSLTGELATVATEVAEARVPVGEPALRLYDRIAARQMPVCVPIHGGKCSGCHLKVSSEVESAARGKSLETELATCDQCGRLVYWES
ncbi:MAG: hypothetical protein K9M98_10420 [Cephaloticoccus sp.]|nr:hypothetical protein [Cephaloticoccus sp.]